MYSSEVQVRDGSNRRAVPRGAAAFDTRYGVPAASTRSPCRIIDISSSGARLRLYQQLPPETSIRLSLPGKGLVDAHIVWADGREAGCRFDRPLDDDTVTVLRASATERGAARSEKPDAPSWRKPGSLFSWFFVLDAWQAGRSRFSAG